MPWGRLSAPRRTLAGISAIVLTLALSASQAVASPTLPLNHASRWLTDANGRVVIVHGLNMVYKRAPYYPSAAGFGEDDAAFLQSQGFNAVRLGVIWKALEPEPGVFDQGYIAHIRETVAMLASHGILSLIDMHQDMYNEKFEGEGAPDWAVQDEGKENTHLGFSLNYELDPALNAAMDNFWADSPGPEGIGLEEYFAGAWRHLASQIAGDSGVMGYEIWNEPWPGNEWQQCAALARRKGRPKPCPTFDTRLDSMYGQVAGAIREADPVTPVYYEPSVIFNFGGPTTTKGPAVSNVGFAFHDYCLNPSPTGCESEPIVIANAVKHAKKLKQALLLTEFGATNSIADLKGVIDPADASMVPWIEWSYCLCEDPTGSQTEGIIQQASQPPTGENLNTGTLDTVVEPYPQLVSGTPESWLFDRETKAFTLTYNPIHATGHGKFADGATTEVAIPETVYSAGYSVSTTGATVTSAANAPVLVLRQHGKPKTITVTVRAAR